MKDIILDIKNLTCGYDSKFQLSDITFKIESNEITGIIGPNGSGKTTLLRAITKILKPEDGEIFIEGKNIWEMGTKELAQKIAVVSQSLNSSFMTVEELVLMGRIPYYRDFQFYETRRDEEVARKYMELTDTYRFKDKLLDEISGGERQLAYIALALTQEPKLLLLDEPTAHLDITHQVQILDLIKRLNRELELTVMMVLHDLNLASEYCGRLILLNNGRIQKIGQPDKVLTYHIIEEVYKTVVIVKKNPISKKPYILLVPEEEMKRTKR